MGLITHNRIYVCIGVSPCLVIVDLVIIGSVGSSHYHASIILFSKGCPSPLLVALCAIVVVAVAPAQAAAPLASTPRVAAPCGLAMGGSPLRAGHWQPPLAHAILQPAPLRTPRCGRLPPLQAGHSPLCPQVPPLRVAAPVDGRPLRVGLGRGLAVGGRACMGVGRGWPPLLLVAFTPKIQQECVERFYMIQSHHTQFKTNLSHENRGSNTIVGKPQRVHHMRNGNQNKNQFPT
ncbi:hypothetical protein GW17_00026361 [Ensete ventricosum]|nr:hypothetical protein GW17_00026361 [Ensete ventricosum]